ncbi:hypothetical protein [Vibrio scophthalmi]|uniref:TrbL/VirB6 plasmid conjugal transfer protein n=1 Tax=Vibrio scophthalmi TaxID=45658 RepID=A0A1E3WIR7_9VIBR|nr:hypothetical protein [Vibrio scophthalmi]ODS09617.1 hypothetical protein VSF3289_03281 [Vibrio scophthalmi]
MGDPISLFENAVNKYFELYFETFMAYFNTTFAVVLIFYWTFHLIIGAIDQQSEQVKSFAACILWVIIMGIFTQSDYYDYWIVELFSDLRNSGIAFFMGDDNATTWDLVNQGFALAIDIMKEDDSWSGLSSALVFGAFMWITFFSVYVTYCVVYLGALLPILVLQFFGAAILMLATVPSWRGVAKLWLQAMGKYTLTCIIASVLVAISVSTVHLSESTGKTGLLTKDGFVTADFLLIVMSIWIIIRFLPKSAEISSDMIGGSSASAAGDAASGSGVANKVADPAAKLAGKKALSGGASLGGAAVNAAGAGLHALLKL